MFSAAESVKKKKPSDSCWAFAVSGMLVVAGVGDSLFFFLVSVMCEGVPSDSEWDFVEPHSFSFSKKRKFACVADQEDMNYEGTLVKAPCPT